MTTDVADGEFDWYTPIAVILKPASQQDLIKRLEELGVDNDQFSSFPDYPYPFSPAIQNQWEFDAQMFDHNDMLHYFYNLPHFVQERLLSLARMGLVAGKPEIQGKNKF